jgi:Domain of unknown function (DUF4388)
MDEIAYSGELSRTPLARVLSEIWHRERSGHLTLRHKGTSRAFYFERGNLAVERETFPEQEFLDSLFAGGTLDLVSLTRSEDYARKEHLTPLRALLELGCMRAERLWNLIESFTRKNLFAAFDWTEGEYAFAPGQAAQSAQLIRGLFLPDLILEGLRQTAGTAVIDAHLPPDEEPVQRLSPYFLDLVRLAPHEKYLWNILDSGRPLGEVVKTSELGPRESRRILFAFLCLGLAGPAQPKGRPARAGLDPLHADMERVFAAFNDRAAYIFKYISKELGPVAVNLIEKSLDEVRGRLDPLFQEAKFKPDGRLELNAPGKTNLNIATEEGRRSLLRSLDEVLAAEVLAAKRALGSAHEADLIRGLEKLGESL